MSERPDPDVKLDPVGLPAALKAWREHAAEPLLTMHCGDPDCDAEVGAVYDSPKGPVVESRMHPLESEEPEAPALPGGMAGLAELGVTGLLDDFTTPSGRGSWLDAPLRVQADLLRNEVYWQNPKPICPHHGEMVVDQHELSAAVRDGHARYVTAPA